MSSRDVYDIAGSTKKNRQEIYVSNSNANDQLPSIIHSNLDALPQLLFAGLLAAITPPSLECLPYAHTLLCVRALGQTIEESCNRFGRWSVADTYQRHAIVWAVINLRRWIFSRVKRRLLAIRRVRRRDGALPSPRGKEGTTLRSGSFGSGSSSLPRSRLACPIWFVAAAALVLGTFPISLLGVR